MAAPAFKRCVWRPQAAVSRNAGHGTEVSLAPVLNDHLKYQLIGVMEMLWLQRLQCAL